ncbi:MAG: cyclodeaminase/cyclohydrolase family protein [Lachnospiraceae bacterium]|nr:cyclodeaminase/cyclohydrolase family protein [Lachnospiraceae bacterium]
MISYEQRITDWMEDLYSKQPVPGGGGASALAGAMAASLDGMVANLTSGKKKYAEYQERIEEILVKSAELKDAFLRQMEEDKIAFEPLSKAYSLPKNTPEELEERDRIMQAALLAATRPPMEMMRLGTKTVDLCEELTVCGSRIAISDVGVSLAMARSAVEGAMMNVVINARLLKDEAKKEAYMKEAEEILADTRERTARLYEVVYSSLKG